MRIKKQKNADPLFQLFEHYLLNRSYEDSATFTKEVAAEYLSYLNASPAHVPFHTRKTLLEDLEAETHEILVKKMYGCVRAEEHANYGKVIAVRRGEVEAFELIPPTSKTETTKKD